MNTKPSRDARSAPPSPCPCGTHQTYAHCCGRWHAGPQQLQAPTAEALMRSRYSAYVLRLEDYLLQTWHPRTRPLEPLALEPGVKWLGLEVKAHAVQDGQHAEVHFVARSKVGGRAHRLMERSRFVREDGRWYYVDGRVEGDAAGTGVVPAEAPPG